MGERMKGEPRRVRGRFKLRTVAAVIKASGLAPSAIAFAVLFFLSCFCGTCNRARRCLARGCGMAVLSNRYDYRPGGFYQHDDDGAPRHHAFERVFGIFPGYCDGRGSELLFRSHAARLG